MKKSQNHKRDEFEFSNANSELVRASKWTRRKVFFNLIFMNRKEKIEAIYEKIARKDLSFGCKIETKY